MVFRSDKTRVDISFRTDITEAELPNAEYVDARGCTGLTSLPELPNAKTVYARGCTGLTSLPELPNAKIVDARGCTGLTSLPELPNAEYVDARGCTGLTSWMQERVSTLLEAGGRKLADVLATGCWDCHSWNNCPMHAAFGVDSIDQVPAPWRGQAALFVTLFDAGELLKPAA